MTPLIVDSFAGGGGASVGIEMALGRSPDVAINHDPVALAMHRANHPGTRHYVEDVWEIDPAEVTSGQPVGLLWLSPDCKHFSKAKGGKPVEKKIRGLAWVAIRWAATVRPEVIVLENVEEFTTWGPLGPDQRPCPRRKGRTFRSFTRALERHGYRVEHRELRACDYGAPTTRKRLFLIARSDGLPIVWPAPTHGPGRIPYRTAAECIDWSIPCPSIFDRDRPLADATLRRIARGLMRYVVEAAEPFIVKFRQNSTGTSIHQPLHTICAGGGKDGRPGTGGAMGLIAPALVQTGYGERPGQAPRCLDLHAPLGTMVDGQKHGLVAAFLAKHYGGPNGNPVDGADLRGPAPTLTGTGQVGPVAVFLARQFGTGIGAPADRPIGTVMPGGCGKTQLVAAFLQSYYRTGTSRSPGDPAPTLTTRDRLGVVTVTIDGQPYAIADIGMRMLQPRELFLAQGFHPGYRIDVLRPDGKTLTKSQQIRCCGNSVCPPIAAAIVRANCSSLAVPEGQLGLWEAA